MGAHTCIRYDAEECNLMGGGQFVVLSRLGWRKREKVKFRKIVFLQVLGSWREIDERKIRTWIARGQNSL